VLPQKQQPRDACSVAVTEKGKIVTAQVSATFVAAIGLTGSVGHFTNLETGTTGYFFTGGAGAGLDVGAEYGGSAYRNLASLVGYNYTVNVSATVGVGLAGSAHFSMPGDKFVGGSGGVSLGAEAGASGSMTQTGLFWCTLGGKK
jgi:hypothetical protein